MKSCLHLTGNIRALLPALAGLSLGLGALTSELRALEPPRPGELQQLRAQGRLEAQLQNAWALGNHKCNERRLQQALAQARRELLKEQGRSEADLPPLTSSLLPGGSPDLPATGNVRVFALLLDFWDYPHSVDSTAVHNTLFGPGRPEWAPTDSLSAYYARASYDLLHLSGATLGWYRPAYNREVVEQIGRDALIREALNYYQALGHDFSQYDNDGDGAIEYFIVMWTGPTGPWASFWWGYQTWFGDSSYKVGGKTLGKYSWQWESEWPGVVIHETGHALGLPDYYDYNDSIGPRGGVGGFDMMDGNWGDHNCFSKWLLGWLSPKVVARGSKLLNLNASGTYPDAVLVGPDVSVGDKFDEFFMVQNRFRVANDVNAPAEGLLIWHVDARLNAGGNGFACDNSYAEHKLLRLMEADGLEDIEQGRGINPGDFYAEGLKFAPNTMPASTLYDGTPSFVRVQQISPPGPTMSARFQGGH